ncbi:TRAP transporter substrate-binding protein [Castellaniella sp.]|uniref:TRAP transporter substrate-binding protein n=1 Tax=Castellaniella sp. TaxID=1955812 RepID=UPI003560271D
MNRRQFNTLALAGVAVAVAGTARAEVESVTLHMAHDYPPGNVWYEAAQRFADGVASRTDGKAKMQIAHSSSTGSWDQNIEGLQIGTNDIVLESIGTLDRYDPLPGVEAFPYLIKDLDHFKKVYYGDVGDAFMDEVARRSGFRIIGAGYRGARKLSANRKVESVGDLAGLKLRVPPLKMYRRTWELLGASPVPMPVTEIFTGLQQGLIDGQENPLEFINTYKLGEVQSHVMNTNHVIGAMTFIFNDGRFKALSPELQQILREEGANAMLWATDRVLGMENDYQKSLEDKGVVFVDVDLPAFREKVAPIADDFPDLKEWVVKFQQAG